MDYLSFVHKCATAQKSPQPLRVQDTLLLGKMVSKLDVYSKLCT